MKNYSIKTIVMALCAMFMFTACSDDKVAAPEITLTEVGHDNSHTAVIGDDMHLEADIEAEGVIKAIYVELHLEDGDFEIEKEYTDGKYVGVKNTEFHEHIDIPAEAPEDEYHLHFTVTDREGQQAQATAHVDVVSNEASM